MATPAIMSTALANKLIDHIFRNTTYYSSSSIYAALYLSNPGDDNSGSEVSVSNYSRAVFPEGTIFTVAQSAFGALAFNSASVSFAKATGSWGNITHFGLFSASQSGSLLFYGPLATGSKAILAGDTMRFTEGNIFLYYYAGLSPGVSQSIFNFILNNVTYPTMGSSIYAGALVTTGRYSINDIGTEMTSASMGYERIPVGGSSFWTPPVSGSSTLNGSIVFSSTASTTWGTVLGIGLYSASAGGDYFYMGKLGTPKMVNKYDGFYIPNGGIVLAIDYPYPPATGCYPPPYNPGIPTS